MRGFRRAQLRGSDELFRPTESGEQDNGVTEAPPEDHPAVTAVPAMPPPDARSVRLSEDEIRVLADALQHVKFPQKSSNRPSVDDFEKLEALRQKLLNEL
ncbi:MAG: hypothetical protein JOZ46_03245 [Candidatus Dormibacteraeota bacterium]|nr:hypothetical protein [Candidatus Dormibacteraeota bacterium]MBV9524816.1 hypothetical protein [Candidatus Dormibacteraeota bacterium]